MKKLAYSFAVLSFLLFGVATPVDASLLVVKEDGSLLWNVLSAESELALSVPKSSIDIEKAGGKPQSGDSKVTLGRDGDKINLTVESGDETSQLDVTNWKEDLVEIEDRPEVQKLSIALNDGKFTLKQKGVLASTSLPLVVDSATSELSIKTDTGEKYLSILPFEAVQSFLRTRLVNVVDKEKIEILEQDGSLAYKISGEKIISFFNLYNHSIPVSSYVSASTGEIMSIDGPAWLKAINFLFG